jgi:hypothetical protein
MSSNKRFKGMVCRNCKKGSLLSIIEQEYDYEISCFNCGELWWIEKEKSIQLKGDDLKYISYTHFEDSDVEDKD